MTIQGGVPRSITAPSWWTTLGCFQRQSSAPPGAACTATHVAAGDDGPHSLPEPGVHLREPLLGVLRGALVRLGVVLARQPLRPPRGPRPEGLVAAPRRHGLPEDAALEVGVLEAVAAEEVEAPRPHGREVGTRAFVEAPARRAHIVDRSAPDLDVVSTVRVEGVRRLPRGPALFVEGRPGRGPGSLGPDPGGHPPQRRADARHLGREARRAVRALRGLGPLRPHRHPLDGDRPAAEHGRHHVVFAPLILPKHLDGVLELDLVPLQDPAVLRLALRAEDVPRQDGGRGDQGEEDAREGDLFLSQSSAAPRRRDRARACTFMIFLTLLKSGGGGPGNLRYGLKVGRTLPS